MWVGNIVVNANKIYEYDLATPFNPSTAISITNVSVTGFNYLSKVIYVNGNVYACGYNNDQSFTTMHRFELSNGSLVGSTPTSATGVTSPFSAGFSMSEDGTNYVMNKENGNGYTYHSYSLSTPYDITSTKTQVGSIDLSSYLIGTTDKILGTWSHDGTQFIATMFKNTYPPHGS